MAQEIVIQLNVEGVDEATQSVEELNKSIEQVQGTVSNGSLGNIVNDNDTKKIDNFEKKLVSSRDVMKSSQATARLLSGSIQLATSTFAAFGVKNEEVAQTLLKVQAASQFAGGIRDLSRGIGGLDKAFGLLNKTLLSNPFVLIATVIATLIVSFVGFDNIIKGITSTFEAAFGPISDLFGEFEDGGKEVDKAKEAIDAYNKSLKALSISARERQIELEFEIELLRQQGATEEELFLKRRQITISQIRASEAEADAARELISELQRKGATEEEIDKAKQKRDEANLETRRLDLQLISIDRERKEEIAKEEDDNSKKFIENKKKELEALREAEEAKILLTEKGSTARFEAELSAIQTIEDFQVKYAKFLEISENGITIIKQKNLEKRKQLEEEYYKNTSKLEKTRIQEITISGLAAQKKAEDEIRIKKLAADITAQLDSSNFNNKFQLDAEELKRQQENLNFIKQLNQQLAIDIQGFSDAIFQYKTRNLEKGSKEEEKFARKQFKINKALSLSTAIISGIVSVLEAYKNGMKNPVPLLGPATAGVYAALAAVSSGALIAKIATTKFESTSTGGSTAPSQSTPSLGTQGSITPQTFQPDTFGTGVSQQQTFGGAGVSGGGNVLRAYVTESDITSTNLRLNSIRNASEL